MVEVLSLPTSLFKASTGCRNKHKSLGRVQSSEILNVPFKMRFLIEGFKNIPVNRRLLFTLNNQHL